MIPAGDEGMMRRDPRLPLKETHPLTIDAAILADLGYGHVAEQLQLFAKSTRVMISHDHLRLEYSGPDLSHHRADPDLGAVEFCRSADGFDLAGADYANFHVSLPEFDLCLEDSWTGYFISRLLANSRSRDSLVLIHLDDHTDMMPTLLSLDSNGMRDPSTARPFDPCDPEDWLPAIQSGAIGIGSWLTGLFYLPHQVHVRHLTHGYNRVDDGAQTVVPCITTTSLLPHARFAAIDRKAHSESGALGTYRSGADPHKLLDDLPEGRVMVHVDLDYFINDYNGNVGAQPPLPTKRLRNRGCARLRVFLDAMQHHGTCVERWLVGTSPGFCSIRHWCMLLAALAEAIPTLGDGRTAPRSR